jgi:ketosteroid isomerase-like protein
MIVQDPIAVAKAYFSAVNETRLDDLAKVFAEKARLEFPQQEPVQGRQAIHDFYAGVLQFYPERFDKVTRYFQDGQGGVAAEIHFEGKTLTGRPVVFDAVDLFRVQGEEIQELRIFYDAKKVLEMVGELPK